ncbi:MAG: aspartate 1-decarboxylase [Candidatus Dormibacteria bacterium]
MQRILLKSKIHRATVTRSDLDYEGSCSIDEELMRLAEIVAGEQVHIANITRGTRAVSYAIAGAPGEIGLNGGMAHLGGPGDLVILMTYGHVDEGDVLGFAPRIVYVDIRNRPRSPDAAGGSEVSRWTLWRSPDPAD